MNRFSGVIARHPNIVALLCGIVTATGLPPLALWPLALPALALFAFQLRGAPDWRSAARLGWLFGLAHFTLANNWIATAFTYQAQMPAALGWAAVPLLSVYLAAYPALAAGLAHRFGAKGGCTGFAALFGTAWILAEYLRATLFTGYSWGPLSLVMLGDWQRPGVAMLLPLTGSYALSGVTAMLCAMGAGWVAGRRWLPLTAIVIVVSAMMLWPAAAPREGDVELTLVQPDLRQEELNDPARFEAQFQRIAALSAPREAAERLVLWPESAVPDYLREGYPQRYYDAVTANGSPAFARARIGQAIGAGGLLLTGAVDLHMAGKGELARATGAYNSITALEGGSGRIVGHYAKAHLVPYGEYLPLRDLLEPLGASRLVAGSIDFIPGPGPRTLDFGPWGRAGMQICYEIIFSGEVIDRANRPDYIFNPSNDGWFGAWGPPQHLAQARMRAIEEGLPVLRATTTGISAVIDAGGVVRAHIPVRRADRIDMRVPASRDSTLFARFGPWLTLAWGVVLLALSVVATRRARG